MLLLPLATALLVTSSALADPPLITPPPDQTVEATSADGAVVTYPPPTVADGAGNPTSASCTPASGTTFALGATSVTCTATDTVTGEGATANFTVTVQDTTAPALALPATIAAEGTSSAGATVSYTVSATDVVDGSVAVSCTPASGSTFSLGSTSVSCSTVDSRGNSATGSFQVNVTDTTPPAITVPSPISAEATNRAGVAVTYSVSAVDVVDGSIVPVCSPTSGATFSVGTTTVACSARDSRGNSAAASFDVAVKFVDRTPPVISVPAEVNVNTEVRTGANVSFRASAVDNADGPLSPRCSPASGSVFPVGRTTVTCTATDSQGNTGRNSFPVIVTLVDTTAPVVTVPAPMTAEAKTALGAVVSYSVSALDNLDGSLTTACTPESGKTFPLGVTSVTCKATDKHGNVGSASFAVTVKDTVAPKIEFQGAARVEANSAEGAVATFAVSAVDAIDGPIVPSAIRCDRQSGSLFGLGSTPVRCVASDASGNVGSAEAIVSVVDTTPPVLNVPAPILLTATSAGLSATSPRIAAFLASARALDLVDGGPTVSSNAPAAFAIGATRVTFTATDSSGNRAEATSTVTLTLEPTPSSPAIADRTAPDNVSELRAEKGNRTIRLRWRSPAAPDFAHVEVSRSVNEVGAPEVRVFRGTGTNFVDRGLTNGTAYRYVVVSFDRTGNRSAGMAIVAAPWSTAVISPLQGARLNRPPLLSWTAAPGATYYNLQLFHGSRKVLSVWPRRSQFRLRKRWTNAGRREQLRPGLYRWYIWSGLGPPESARFGPLHGQGNFVVVP